MVVKQLLYTLGLILCVQEKASPNKAGFFVRLYVYTFIRFACLQSDTCLFQPDTHHGEVIVRIGTITMAVYFGVECFDELLGRVETG